MRNALILHGTMGSPKENWFPWLKKELEKNNCSVWIPDLPGADKPNCKRYNDFIFPKWTFTKESIIIGHSSGAVATLGIMQYIPESVVIKKAILVAGFTTNLDWEALNDLFIFHYEWEKIRKRAEKIILFHSDDDPYVPLWHGEKLRDLLKAELIVMPGQKHFSTSTKEGYNKFPKVLEKILE